MSYINEINIQKFVRIKEQLRIINDNNGPALIINQTGTENILDIQQNSNTVFYIENEGNVGIGTNNPSTKLDVNGIIKGDGSQITNLNYNNITNQPALDNVSDSNFDNKFSYKSTNDLIEGINLYYTEDRVNQNILSKNLISLNEENLNSNQLVYYDGESWYNLKIDPRSLEITTDRVLRVIGGTSSGNLNQVVYENETTTTVTSNIEKPIIDNNFVTDGLIAHYKFDGDFNDSSGNNNLLLSGVNDPIFVDNKYLQFQDNIDTSTLTNNVRHGTVKIPSIDLVNKEFTVSIWFKKTGTLIQSGILILGEDERVSDTGHFEIYTKPNEIKANYRTNSSEVVWDAIVINPVLNQWHNIVLVVSNTSIIGYLDNVLVKTTSISNKLPDGIYDTNYLGCMNNATSISTSDKYLLDDFRIYNRALLAAEVEKLYLEGSDRGLIAYYKFDDSTNIGLNSASTGSNLNATLNGTPTLETTKGVFNNSCYFSGAGDDDSLVIDSNGSKLYNHLHQKPITISFWCWSISSGQSGHGRVFYGSPTGSEGNINSIQCVHWSEDRSGTGTENNLTFIISNNGEGFDNNLNFSATTKLSAFNTGWSHVVFVLEPTSTNWTTKEHNHYVYVNGVLDQSYTNKWMPKITQNYNFQIGRWTYNEDSREYDGYIDDFRIYDRALSAVEVENLYNAQYIQKSLITDSTDEYIAFKYNPDLYPDIVYDFTSYNDINSWTTYANSIGSTNITGSSAYFTDGGVYLHPGDGYFTLNPIPLGYDYISIEFSNPWGGIVKIYINGTEVDSATVGQSKTYSQTVSSGDIFKIEELNISIIGEDLKITLSNTQTEYTINFPEDTECDILIVGGGGAGGWNTAGGGGSGAGIISLNNTFNGTYTIKV